MLNNCGLKTFLLFLIVFLLPDALSAEIPYLEKTSDKTFLMVDQKPFLILGGELGNSSASNKEYMQDIWPELKAMHLNTVLSPVYWELLEPQEGQFDFTHVDTTIDDARKHGLRLVLLWFGSWKNSMSSYVPGWVKRDTSRFPRAYDSKGIAQEILSPFHRTNLEADKNAFMALMSHLKEVDTKHNTVIMIQVENEIGMLPDARDYHSIAQKKFTAPVPQNLIDYLNQHRQTLVPEIQQAWAESGYQQSGNWNTVFGENVASEEIFMAWYFGQYVEEIAAAGKAIYPLPMFINAALNRPGVLPGDYPSAGPLPHLMDIWKAATPSIDFLAPDFYNSRFKHWNDLYVQQGDPLFIPEHRFDVTVSAKAFFSIGHYNSLGFSPFSVESANEENKQTLASTYEILDQISPLILHSDPNQIVEGVWLTKDNPKAILNFGSYQFSIKHDLTLGWSAESKDEQWTDTGAVIIQIDDEHFYVAGTGVVIQFSVNGTHTRKAGIDSIYEGEFIENAWQPGRSMNGDQSHQGRHLRIPYGQYGIQKLTLYQYE